MAQPAACACGQVLFDIGDKKPGDALACPWCERKYRYAGGGKVELIDAAKGADGATEPKARASGEHAKSGGETEKRPTSKSERHKKAEPEEKKEKPPEKEPSEKREKKADAHAAHAAHSAHPSHGAHKDHDLVVRPSVRKRAVKQEIPGGVLTMVTFIVIFNALAFIALYLLLPKQTDGTRLTPWGTIIPKSSIWPEIVALLAGHFVGFIAWSTYLYKKQFKPQDSTPPTS